MPDIDNLPPSELLKAIRKKDLEAVRNLLECGADPNGIDHEDNTPYLCIAISREPTGELAKLLIDFNANINAVNAGSGTTATMYAARNNNVALAYLIGRGAALDVEDGIGRTALKWASQSKNKKAQKMIKTEIVRRQRAIELARAAEIHEVSTSNQISLLAHRGTTIVRMRPVC